WRDGQRTYLCMPIDKNAAIPPSLDVLRVSSVTETAPATTNGNGHIQQPTKKERIMTTNQTEEPHSSNGSNGPIEQNGTSIPLTQQARAWETALRDCLVRTPHLVTSIRKTRKNSRLVETTLATLKELQHIAS